MNKKLIYAGIFLFLLIGFLWAIEAILLPFILAFVLAYLLNPLVNKLSKYIGRGMATAVVVVSVLVVLAFGLFLFIPVLQAQITGFISRIPLMAEKLWSYLKDVVLWGKPEMSYQEMYRLSDTATQTAMGVLNAFGAGLNRLISGGLAVMNILMLVFISPIVLFYVLKDLPMVQKKCVEMIPHRHRETVKKMSGELSQTLSAFLRGQASLSFILMVYYGVALSLTQLDLGGVIGLATGLLSFIPYVGFFTGLAVALIMVLIQGGGWSLFGWVMAVYCVGSVLESYILTPYLVGRRVGLSPFWVLFALLACGSLFGFLGVLVAVPLAAIAGVLIRWGYKWYQNTPFFKGK